MTPRRPTLVGLAAAAALVLAACSSSARTAPAAAPSTDAAVTSTTASPALSGRLEVFAAASLTGAFGAARSALTASVPALDLTVRFGGSNALVAQIEQGAPADVFASADQPNMQKLVAAGLVDPPVTFARNKLEIAVAPGNPRHIASLADLARPGLTVVLEAPGVPAGDYTRQVARGLGVTITPRSLAPDVKTAVTSVTSGEADATVVYVTDVLAAGGKVTGVPVADNLQPAIAYPIAVVKAGRNQAAARAFVGSAVSGRVQQALLAQGFLPP